MRKIGLMLVILMLGMSISGMKLLERRTVTEEVEPYLMADDWEGAFQFIGTLPKNDPNTDKLFQLVKALKFASVNYEKAERDLPSKDVRLKYYDDKLRYDWPKVPKQLPFSEAYVMHLNSSHNELISKRNKLADEIMKEQQARTDEYNARVKAEAEAEAAEARKIQEQIAADQAARDRVMKAQELAENSLEFKRAELIRSISEAMYLIRDAERDIAQERQYAAMPKYGVLDLSLINSRKQRIKGNNNFIAEQKAEYRKLTKQPFNESLCKGWITPDDEHGMDKLDKLRRQLMLKYGATEDDLKGMF